MTIDTVVMSGGAPQSPLMAGFLYALLKERKTFKNFHTSGAGALMALLLIAPKNGNPCRALKNWVEAGVDDQIYAGLPVNFKLFRKPGPFASLFHLMAERFKVPRAKMPAEGTDPARAVLAEWFATSTSPNDKNAIDRLETRFLNLWRMGPDPNVLGTLRQNPDPIKRLRDVWLTNWLRTDDERRIYNDFVDLWFSALTPSTLTYKSKCLAAPLPFLEDLVCFEKARHFGDARGGHFCVNAYNMTADAKLAKPIKLDRRTKNQTVMYLFESPRVNPAIQKEPLGPEHIRAAFSMPFIYPPARIGDDFYSEGADHQPLNFHESKTTPGPRTIVLLDVLAELEDLLVRTPRDLWDAYVISIMTPVVALAHEDVDDFGNRHADITVIPAGWNIPQEFQPFLMDWSFSNLDKLFEVGKEAGNLFLFGDGTGAHLPYKDQLPDYQAVFGCPLPQCD